MIPDRMATPLLAMWLLPTAVAAIATDVVLQSHGGTGVAETMADPPLLKPGLVLAALGHTIIAPGGRAR